MKGGSISKLIGSRNSATPGPAIIKIKFRRVRKPNRKLLSQRKELIERYVRMAVQRKASELGQALARKIMRPKLRWAERTRTRVLKSTLETVAFECNRVNRLGFDAMATVLNVGLFFLIAERDLQAVKIDALTHHDPWQRNLAARIMLLTIHELDIDKVAGNKLRQALNEADVPQHLRDAVTEALRAVRKAQSNAQRRFAYLRNATIAHRDGDARRQYRDIVEIDSMTVAGIAAEFYAGTKLFMDVLPRLTLYLGTWPSMSAQLQAQMGRKKLSQTGST
jgi:hypothetical protein